MRIKLQFAGANDDGDKPSHISLTGESINHSGCRVAWVRWVCYHDNGRDPEYGRWEPVVPGKPYVDPRPGYLG